MSIKKTLVTVTAITAVIAPLLPDKININLNVPISVNTKADKQYEIVTTTCTLSDTFKDQKGHMVCEYTCTEMDQKKITRMTFNSAAMCQFDIKERMAKKSK